MEPKVSVIVPVYNCEKYLRQCIDSLLIQSLEECEFIFVNDGSFDSSVEIIKEYSNKDSRIKIISQENRGVSVARNTGIELANGEYIGFVDADDYIDKNYFFNLYKVAKDNSCDIVIANWISTQDGYKTILKLSLKQNILLYKDYIEKVIYPCLLGSDSLNSVCNKIYLKKLVNDKNIRFPIGVGLGEDGTFNTVAFTYAKNCYYLDYNGYYYREVNGSATRNITDNDYLKKAIASYNETIKEVNKWKIGEEEIKKLKGIRLINNVVSFTYIYFTPQRKNKFLDRYKYVENMVNTKQVREAFKEYSDELTRDKGMYEKLIIRCIKSRYVFGIYLLTVYSRWKNNKERNWIYECDDVCS